MESVYVSKSDVTTMRVITEDKFFIKWLEVSKCTEQSTSVRCFPDRG